MADTSAPAKADGGSTFGFLSHKLFGKVPVWVVAVAAVGGYYWYTRYGPGKTAAAGAAQGVQGTDPAGNTGVIDPATGFVYGSPEDLAILQGEATSGYGGNNPGDGSGSGGSGGSGGPVNGGPIHVPQPVGPIPKGPGEGGPPPGYHVPYPGQIQQPKIGGGDLSLNSPKIAAARSANRSVSPKPSPVRGASTRTNTEWQGQAVSNLISQGVPPDMASTSIQAHLNGQPLSPAMAANRDLAVNSIGPAPQVPRPGQMKAPLAR